jgi:hypothetical protein
MSNRSITGIATIPAAPPLPAPTGTVTADTVDSRYLKGAGTNFLSLVEETKNSQTPTNYWVFIDTANELRRIVGVVSDTVLLLDQATTASGNTYSILLANLKGWEVQNVGAGAGTVNGVSLPVNKEVKSGEYFAGNNYAYSPPTWVNGTGTTLLVTEFNKKP